MRNEEDNDYSTEFLSPSRSPRKGTSRGVCRRESGKEGEIVSPSKVEKTLQLLSPTQIKKLSPFGRKGKNSFGKETDSTDIGALLSPQLEKQLTKIEKCDGRRKSFLSPLNSLGKNLRESFHAKGTMKQCQYARDSEEESENDSSDEDSIDDGTGSGDEVEKLATEDDLMILLCRELELITGEDSDAVEDNDDENVT